MLLIAVGVHESAPRQPPGGVGPVRQLAFASQALQPPDHGGHEGHQVPLAPLL